MLFHELSIFLDLTNIIDSLPRDIYKMTLVSRCCLNVKVVDTARHITFIS